MPDNAIYYYLAYAAATGIYAGYSLLLVARRNKARSGRGKPG